ncbi:MAG: ABC transporter ATP-binding protein [Syntrophobacteraceae bacterium CG07_land_8_20_14_0_80_61_8]|nr:MAG: ABC transporter ATP-binding protein [Syntrophobacteraceae bacterium CG07_land_8_20_14_0_80_61_8]
MNNVADAVLVHALGIGKTFDNGPQRVELFKDVELILRRGERLAIVGASGAGKSTLLHILGALDRPSSGKVLHGGQDVMHWDERRLAGFRNRHIGFVFQFHYLLPEFSAMENVMMAAFIAGIPRKEAEQKATHLLTRLGLTERMRHRPNELSGGEQQRVAVARALVLEPQLLLADEPSGNLDTRTGRRLHELLVELNEQLELAMVVVTHNQELAAMMHRTLILADGQLKVQAHWPEHLPESPGSHHRPAQVPDR